jgi:hypothetical protein
MMVLIDYSRKLWKGSEHSLADLPHVVQTIDDIEQLDEFYEILRWSAKTSMPTRAAARS